MGRAAVERAREGRPPAPSGRGSEALTPPQPSVALLLGGASAGAAPLLHDAYHDDPLVREEVDHCIDVLDSHLPVDAASVLLGPRGSDGAVLPPASSEQISTFVFEVAIGKRIQAALPVAWLAGYSVGEQAAACLAGVIDVDDALAVISSEARWATLLPRGAMIVVPFPEHEAVRLLRPGVWLASVETPRLCVLSGVVPAIDATVAELRRENVQVMRLPVKNPFHSPLVGELRDETVALLRKARLRAPKVPLLSSVTGAWMTDAQAASVHYWRSRRTKTLRFGDALRTLADAEPSVYVEVSDDGALGRLLLENRDARDRVSKRIVRVVSDDGTLHSVKAVVEACRASGPYLRSLP